VTFPRGKTSTTLIGSLKGDLTRDYVVSGKAGQTLSVTMTSSNKSAYFNVLPPGSADEAIFIGSTSGNSFSDTLSGTGPYKVRVYLMRSAARKNESANYTLKVSLSGMGGQPAPAESTDALVAGTDYNATATIECAGYRDHPAGRCPAGVKRNREGGVTIVEIQWPKGDSRTLFFKDGKILSANTNEADGSAAYQVTGERKDDVTTVRIGPERYVIPDAFILGG
jgi:hypothetical protein